MLHILWDAEVNLREMLSEPNDSWNTMDITYHDPHVQRCWKQFRTDYRVMLHRIHPCGHGNALWHSHPWPSAVSIVSGTYEHDVGYMDDESNGKTILPLTRTLLERGSRYEMLNPKAWHSVRPISPGCLTIMVTGVPYKEKPTRKPLAIPDERQGPLSDEVRDELLAEFHRRC